MEDPFSFEKIKFTPGWYYRRWPGFYNVECYNILSQWEGGVRTREQYEEDLKQLQEGMELIENKKRGREDEELEGVEETKENVIHSKL
jgi:hypothetical protein